MEFSFSKSKVKRFQRGRRTKKKPAVSKGSSPNKGPEKGIIGEGGRKHHFREDPSGKKTEEEIGKAFWNENAVRAGQRGRLGKT